MKLRLIVTSTGYAPADEEAMAARKKWHKPGTIVTADVKVPRNPKFLKKYMALLRVGFEAWEPPADHEFKGRPIEKDFERFRHDVAILAGFYTPVWNLKGEMRIEPKSIAFDAMEDDEFERLYSATIDVLLKQVLSAKGYGRADVDRLVTEILRFD